MGEMPVTTVSFFQKLIQFSCVLCNFENKNWNSWQIITFMTIVEKYMNMINFKESLNHNKLFHGWPSFIFLGQSFNLLCPFIVWQLRGSLFLFPDDAILVTLRDSISKTSATERNKNNIYCWFGQHGVLMDSPREGVLGCNSDGDVQRPFGGLDRKCILSGR